MKAHTDRRKNEESAILIMGQSIIAMVANCGALGAHRLEHLVADALRLSNLANSTRRLQNDKKFKCAAALRAYSSIIIVH